MMELFFFKDLGFSFYLYTWISSPNEFASLGKCSSIFLLYTCKDINTKCYSNVNENLQQYHKSKTKKDEGFAANRGREPLYLFCKNHVILTKQIFNDVKI